MANFRRVGDNQQYQQWHKRFKEQQEHTELEKYIDGVLNRMSIAVIVCFLTGILVFKFFGA